MLTMPGRSMSYFHRPGEHCLHQARNTMEGREGRGKGGGGVLGGGREKWGGGGFVYSFVPLRFFQLTALLD